MNTTWGWGSAVWYDDGCDMWGWEVWYGERELWGNAHSWEEAEDYAALSLDQLTIDGGRK